MVGATLRKKSWISSTKIEQWLISSGKPRAVENMYVTVACQVDLVKKQIVSPLSWNSLLSKTSLCESYVLTIYRYLEAKGKTLLGFEGFYNM